MRQDRRRVIDFPLTQPQAAARSCDHGGCRGEGLYRAPRSRDNLNEYYWFCLDHVRHYNARWDYYAGMKPDEIERHLRADIGWQRPTWRLGSLGSPTQVLHAMMRDDFGVFGGAGVKTEPPRREATPEEKALGLFGLTPPVSIHTIKARFKELVKRHHPDANGGDKAAEERLRIVIQAYHLLMASMTA